MITITDIEKSIQRIVDEINQRHNPIGFFKNIPIYVRKDIPQNEVWFISLREPIKLVNIGA